MSKSTIAERLRAKNSVLTRSERQLSDVILKNYPVSGLGSITSIARQAQVSTPTVARLVQKLGLSGFPELQAILRQELGEQISSPISKRDLWAGGLPHAHIMNRFTDAVMGNIQQTLGEIDVETFDRACQLLSDEDRSIFVFGGRITRSLADHFFLHMQVVRQRVTHVTSNSNAWPHYLLDVKEGDVFAIYDIRRYETTTLKLAELASRQGAQIILFTDQWQSPVSELANLMFCHRIVVPSAWDSLVTGMLLNEIIISDVQERIWGTSKERIESLEDIFDRTRFFRKF